MNKEIEALDDERYRDLKAAEKRTLARLDGASSGPKTGALLGVLASIRRQQGLLDHAGHLLAEALEEAGADGATRGRLLQRLAYLAFDRGDAERALGITYEATSEMAVAGDADGVGRTLVDRARFEYHLERPADALRTNLGAKRFLAPTSNRHRFTVELGIGLCASRLGDLETAKNACGRSLALPVGDGLRLHALCLRAEIAESEGDLLAAGDCFLESSRVAALYSPGNALLAGIRGLRCLVRVDRSRAADRSIELARFLGPFARTREVAEPLRELLRDREGLDGKTLALLESRFAEAIQKRRAARARRAARRLRQVSRSDPGTARTPA